MLRRGFRKIHHQGVWQYKIGCQYVILYSPEGNRHLATCESLSGHPDFERARWKGYDQITPSMILGWIKNERTSM